ncbi:MAG: ATP-binding protein [Bacteroidales bacterium]|jgi:MinD superfamily P-loop ATPase|nr:ATP-binding protein [Bacteroidales bacterium]
MVKIAIASGKGGTGKTFVSTNLYHVMKMKGESVILADCDAEEPNDINFFHPEIKDEEIVKRTLPEFDLTKCVFCGKCADSCAFNAIFMIPGRRKVKLIDDLCHGCGVCSYVCDFRAVKEKIHKTGKVSVFYSETGCKDGSVFIEGRMCEGARNPVPVIAATVNKAVSECTEAGIVLLDSPPGSSCSFVNTVSRADFVILVTEPTPFGLNDLKLASEVLAKMKKKCLAVINKSGMGNGDVYSFLLSRHIPVLAELPYDKNSASYYSEGKLAVMFDDRMRNRFLVLYDNLIKLIK